MKRVARLSALSLCVPALAANAQELATEGPELDVSGRWHNRYVSEGRDQLGGDDLFSVAGGLQWDDWAAGGWFGNAYGRDYREMNLFVERGLELGPARVYGRYTRLHYLADGTNDNELSAGASVTLLDLVEATADYTHSTRLEGGFVSLSLGSEISAFTDRLSIGMNVAQNFDYGFASPDHDGANNVQAGLDAELRLGEKLRLVGSIAHSWAQDDVEHSGGGDLTWGSLGLATQL